MPLEARAESRPGLAQPALIGIVEPGFMLFPLEAVMARVPGPVIAALVLLGGAAAALAAWPAPAGQAADPAQSAEVADAPSWTTARTGIW